MVVVVISYGPLVGRSCFLEASRWLLVGTMEMGMPRAPKMTPKNGFGPSNATAKFGTLLLCQILPFHIPPSRPLSDPLANRPSLNRQRLSSTGNRQSVIQP